MLSSGDSVCPMRKGMPHMSSGAARAAQPGDGSLSVSNPRTLGSSLTARATRAMARM